MLAEKEENDAKEKKEKKKKEEEEEEEEAERQQKKKEAKEAKEKLSAAAPDSVEESGSGAWAEIRKYFLALNADYKRGTRPHRLFIFATFLVRATSCCGRSRTTRAATSAAS